VLGAFLFGCTVAMQPAVAAKKSLNDFGALFAEQFAPLQRALFKAEEKKAAKKEEIETLKSAEQILKSMELKEESIVQKKNVPSKTVPPGISQDLKTLQKEEKATKLLEKVVEGLEKTASPEERKLLEVVDKKAAQEEAIIKEKEVKKQVVEKKADSPAPAPVAPPPAPVKKAEDPAQKPAPPPVEKKGEDKSAEKPAPSPTMKKVEDKPAEKPALPSAEKKAEVKLADSPAPPPLKQKAEDKPAEKPSTPPATTVETPQQAAAILQEEKKVEAVIEQKIEEASKEIKKAEVEIAELKKEIKEAEVNATKAETKPAPPPATTKSEDKVVEKPAPSPVEKKA